MCYDGSGPSPRDRPVDVPDRTGWGLHPSGVVTVTRPSMGTQSLLGRCENPPVKFSFLATVYPDASDGTVPDVFTRGGYTRPESQDDTNFRETNLGSLRL